MNALVWILVWLKFVERSVVGNVLEPSGLSDEEALQVAIQASLAEQTSQPQANQPEASHQVQRRQQVWWILIFKLFVKDLFFSKMQMLFFAPLWNKIVLVHPDCVFPYFKGSHKLYNSKLFLSLLKIIEPELVLYANH